MAGDYSLSGHTVTCAGTLQMSGEELIFDGSNDYMTVADHADWQFNGDFTLEFFGVKFASITTLQGLAGHTNGVSGNIGWAFLFRGGDTPKTLNFQWSTDGSTNNSQIVAWTPTLNQAYNICVERSGTTLRFYVDGAFLGSITVSGTTFNSTSALAVGAANSGGGSKLNGRLKAVRITKGVARYATNTSYTVPSLPLPTS